MVCITKIERLLGFIVRIDSCTRPAYALEICAATALFKEGILSQDLWKREVATYLKTLSAATKNTARCVMAKRVHARMSRRVRCDCFHPRACYMCQSFVATKGFPQCSHQHVVCEGCSDLDTCPMCEDGA